MSRLLITTSARDRSHDHQADPMNDDHKSGVWSDA
jgi:hypothetical protein